jgi:hypothetical protein
MVIKIPTSSAARPYRIDPNWDFWFENIPSGNSALRQREGEKEKERERLITAVSLIKARQPEIR